MLGVSRDKHKRWQKDGLLDDSEEAGVEDAIELAILERLNRTVGPLRAKRAWRLLRPMLRQRAGKRPGAAWMVVEEGTKRDAVAFSTRELAECAARERLIWVIPLAPLAASARSAFAEHTGGG